MFSIEVFEQCVGPEFGGVALSERAEVPPRLWSAAVFPAKRVGVGTELESGQPADRGDCFANAVFLSGAVVDGGVVSGEGTEPRG